MTCLSRLFFSSSYRLKGKRREGRIVFPVPAILNTNSLFIAVPEEKKREEKGRKGRSGQALWILLPFAPSTLCGNE